MVTARARALAIACVGGSGKPGRASAGDLLRCNAREGERRREASPRQRHFGCGSRAEETFASLVVVSIAMQRARAPPAGLTFRFGQPADVLPIATTLLKEKMNPLAIDHSRFIVCESASTGERVGFGQIRQLSASKAPDPKKFDARPGSRTLQADLDDDAWEDFESLGPVPHGLDSLPWSPGYRALSDRAVLQRARRRARLEQAAGGAEPLWELASVYVDAGWRRRGLGSALVRKLLRRHAQRGYAFSDVYLLTLDPRSAWYARHGFAVVDAPERVPSAMAFEMGAGKALSFLIGNRLVCMRGGGDVS